MGLFDFFSIAFRSDHFTFPPTFLHALLSCALLSQLHLYSGRMQIATQCGRMMLGTGEAAGNGNSILSTRR